MTAWQAESVTLTVAESFQIAKDIVEKETSSSPSCSQHAATSSSIQPVTDMHGIT